MKIFKKLMLCLLSVVCLMSSINFVYADSYTLKEEFDGNWRYGSGKTGNPTKMWINSNSWSSAVSNDNEVFCLDSTKTSVPGAYNQVLTPQELGLSQDLVYKLALVVYYGYRSNKSVTNYFLTQNLIWELIGKKSHDGTIQHVVNSSYPTRASQDAWQKDILAKVDNFMKLPSFDAKTYEVKNGTSTTIEDTNKVLSGLKIKSVSNGSAKIDGNKLIVTPNGKGDMRIYFERSVSQAQTKANFIVTNSDGAQPVSNLCSGNDPYSASVNIKVVEPKGSIQIRKKCSYDDKLVSGAVYSLTNSNGKIVSYITTIADGEGWVKIDDLALDTYILKEVKVPDGYQLDTNTYEINLSHDGLVASKTVYDDAYGYLEIRKKASNSADNKFLGGAIYGVYNANNQLVESLETKADGSWIKSKQLPLGMYTIKETKAPLGYILDTNSYKVEIKNPNQTLQQTFEDEIIKANVRIVKTDGYNGDLMQGVTFNISDKKDMSNVLKKAITNEKGIAYFYDLAYGTYYIQEEYVNGYQLNNTIYQVEVKQLNQEVLVEVVNNPIKTFFDKVDETTNKRLANVKLQVIDKETNEVIDEWISDGKTPHEILYLNLNKTYIFKEVETIEGYTLSEPIEFTLKDSLETITITMKNKPYTDFSKVDATTEEELEGAKLQVIDKETNEVIDEWISSNIPHRIIGLITNKTYILHEDLAPVGYQVASDIEFVAGSKTKVVMKDEIIKGSVRIYKSDNNSGKMMEGVTFKISDKKDMSNIIKQVKTDADGVASFTNLRYGTYYIQEGYVNGYQVNNKLYEVKIKDMDQEIIIEISNQPIKTFFDKVDETTNERLANVKLQVIDKETNMVIDEWISDGKKPHEILYLNLNKTYIFKEVETIEGYTLSEPIEFILKDSLETITITMKNKPYCDFSKVDATTNEEIAGAKLQVIDKETNEVIDEWISSNIPHRIIGLITNKTYILHEELAPLGYDLANDIEFIAGTQSKVIMHDKPYLLIEKIDANTLQPLVGAKLQIIDASNNEIVAEWISSNRSYKVNNLISGKRYILHEVEAPLGYGLAKDVEFIAKPYNKITMEDKPALTIYKKDKDSNENLVGVTLQIIDYETNEVLEEWVSDGNGYEVNSLCKGKKYILREIKALNDYDTGEDFIFAAGEFIEINYYNTKLKGDLNIIKIDQHKQIISQGEFEFALYADKEMQKLVTKVKIVDGKITIEDLTYGTYYLKELKASKPYIKTNEIFEIVIDKEEVKIEVINDEVVVTGRNNPYYLLVIMLFGSGLYMISYRNYKLWKKRIKK